MSREVVTGSLRSPRSAVGGLALCVVFGVACSGGADGNDASERSSGGATNTGGTPSSGGTTSSGGLTASGGRLPSAGLTGAGGSGGAGGSTVMSSGGLTASGGGAGMGGVSGAAGSAGSAGRGGVGGAAGADSGGAGTAGASGGSGGAVRSSGCGKSPTLKNSPATSMFNYNTLTSGSASRRYILRLPEDYDNERPYRLILGFHGATGNGGQVAGNPAFFGLYALSNGSTIFVAPDAVDGLWSAASDLVFVDDILEQVTADLCVDTSRIVLEGFSQGAAMARAIACARPEVIRATVGHSAGGVALPATCPPIAYFGSLGLQESSGKGGQETQTDFFASSSGCTVEALPKAPTGGHVCTDYSGCSAGHPVRWCSYDGGHTPAPNDSGKNSSWMPEEVWTFLSQF